MSRRVLTNVSKQLTAVIGISSVITAAFLVLPWPVWSWPAAVPDLRSSSHHTPSSPQDWGELVAGITTTYAIYKQDFVYGDAPFLITDMRPEDKYLD